MFDDILERAVELRGRGEPFALATVVACKPPTSAKPGAKAVVTADGSFSGWVGGSCAQPIVTSQALTALRDGRPRLLLLTPNPAPGAEPLEGVVTVPMTCQSEGTLEIYIEPFLPKPELVIIGQSPMARSLAALGKSLNFAICASDPAATPQLFPDADSLVQDLTALKARIAPGSSVIVATMGHYDEEALAAVIDSPARYLGLIASPKRGKAVFQYLRDQGVSAEDLQRVKYPAGLNIGAVTAEEIALSILAEIVQQRRTEEDAAGAEAGAEVDQAAPLEATDPVCGMTVATIEARYRSTDDGETFYFCCLRCKETFDQAPDKYRLPGLQA
ncbi:MAG: XdhC family protein [Dehalococcoidia bacterium]